MFSLSDYQFHLPDELIAETAAHPAHSARLIVFGKNSQKTLFEGTFADLPQFLEKNTVFFFNNSRVLRARIPLVNQEILYENATKNIASGEIFFLKKIDSNHFEALVRPGKKLRLGAKIILGNYILTITEQTDFGRIFHLDGGEIFDLLEQFGELPLPPYIEYAKEKEKDYQSIFAKKNGSVAAPTASLHFSEELLEKIPNERFFVTLHIGMGTFKTIDTDDIREYNIHAERSEIEISLFETIFHLKNSQKSILAVGTTACRTLESLPSLWKHLSDDQKNIFSLQVQHFWENLSINAEKSWISEIIFSNNSIEFSTQAYIMPGYTFRIIDELITNFHLPESSLLVLVSALIGRENLMHLYEDAIAKKYRFFSFGDGMYVKNEKKFANSEKLL